MSFVNGGNGFGSQSTLVVHFGLAEASQVDRLEVIWPFGQTQVFENVAADRTLRLTEGDDKLVPFAGTVKTAPPRPGATH
jgi:hypothetical protein